MRKKKLEKPGKGNTKFEIIFKKEYFDRELQDIMIQELVDRINNDFEFMKEYKWFGFSGPIANKL